MRSRSLSLVADLGNYLMGALPNATLIGFTGTPVDKTAQGKGTFKVCGHEDDPGYLDKYSIAESIADGTTVRLRHTLAPARVLLPTERLEQEFYALTDSEGLSDIEDLNKVLKRAVHLRAFLKSDERVDAVAKFVAEHPDGLGNRVGDRCVIGDALLSLPNDSSFHWVTIRENPDARP